MLKGVEVCMVECIVGVRVYWFVWVGMVMMDVFEGLLILVLVLGLWLVDWLMVCINLCCVCVVLVVVICVKGG